jgi:hypothetical protein
MAEQVDIDLKSWSFEKSELTMTPPKQSSLVKLFVKKMIYGLA